jgi:hypothetical protein
MDSTTSPKVKTTKRRIGALSLARNISGLEGCAKAPRWGLGRLTSNSITHTDLHKPNNKLVSVELEHFWCTDEPQTNTDSLNSPLHGLGGSHHLPLYNIFWVWPWGQHPNAILSPNSQVGIPKFSKLGLS